MFEHLDHIGTDAWLVVIDVAGCKDRDFTRGAITILHIDGFGLLDHLTQFLGRKFRQPSILVDAKHALDGLTHGFPVVHSINRFSDDWNAGKFSESIGIGQDFIAHWHAVFLMLHGFGL